MNTDKPCNYPARFPKYLISCNIIQFLQVVPQTKQAADRQAVPAGLRAWRGSIPASPATFSPPKSPSSNNHLSHSKCCLSVPFPVLPRASRALSSALLFVRLSFPRLLSSSHGSRLLSPPTPAFPQPASSASPPLKVCDHGIICVMRLDGV